MYKIVFDQRHNAVSEGKISVNLPNRLNPTIINNIKIIKFFNESFLGVGTFSFKQLVVYSKPSIHIVKIDMIGMNVQNAGYMKIIFIVNANITKYIVIFFMYLIN